MSNLKLLSKLFFFLILFPLVTFGTEPVDIWQQTEQNEGIETKTDLEIENKSSTKLDVNKTSDKIIGLEKISDSEDEIVGLFDPELNDLNLSIWSNTDGEEIKSTLSRIQKLKLSPYAQELLFNILFTNSYGPKSNLSNEEFLEMKIKWLILNDRKKDLEMLLITNPLVGKKAKVVRFLVEEDLVFANIFSACEKAKFLDKDTTDSYLEKLNVLCLIKQDRKDEAALYFDILTEKGLKDKFFEDKINFLLGITSETSQKINDKNLLNFYLSQTTVDKFNYKPNNKTKKLIWRYLTSANLIDFSESGILEEMETIKLYESAAAQGTFKKEEIFTIYRKHLFSINQLLNVDEIYKDFPGHKGRALVYQSILLTENVEKKIRKIFLLNNLFTKDNLEEVFSDEIKRLLKEISRDEIPENFLARVDYHIKDKYELSSNIEFDNNIIHRSKILKYILEENYPIKKVEKDLKSVYKKVKKNKKYFVSIKDIVLLETLQNDGIKMPSGLNYQELSEKLTIPEGLQNMVVTQQTGLALLKIIEIIGEDRIQDLDPETIYFLNKILNQLKIKKIRNQILSQALPLRV